MSVLAHIDKHGTSGDWGGFLREGPLLYVTVGSFDEMISFACGTQNALPLGDMVYIEPLTGKNGRWYRKNAAACKRRGGLILSPLERVQEHV